MKKKKILKLLLALVLILNSFNLNTHAQNNNMNTSEIVPTEAYKMASNYYKDMLQILIDEAFENIICDIDEVCLGTPFVIIECDSEQQDAIYYFPIVQQDNILAVLNIINTSQGYSASLDLELVTFLNNINYETKCNYSSG